MFLPFQQVWSRVERDKADSDASYCNSLMYAGEFLCKVVVLGLTAAIRDDAQRMRYAQMHRLVRADGVGEWAAVADNIMTGPPAQYLLSEAYEEQRELTQKESAGSWQYEALITLRRAAELAGCELPELPAKAQGKLWLFWFAALRNRTRGHGAPKPSKLSRMCEPLCDSIENLFQNFQLFKREWAHLHRNLSGKYRVTPLTQHAESYGYLKQVTTECLEDGIYIYLDVPVRVELFDCKEGLEDFYVPNGAFTGKQFEMLSYASDDVIKVSATAYQNPPGTLPLSETHARQELEQWGECLTNAPRPAVDYIKRSALEKELLELLVDDRRPTITLVGRGGIGKTSLALNVLAQLVTLRRYDVILWFSARDIDLQATGPKPVRPDVLQKGDIATEYAHLMDLNGTSADHRTAFERALETTENGCCLFIFDNFETLSAPGDIYKWIDSFIRLPNKILVTTRLRDFKGDFPLEVGGMTESEAGKLMDTTARKYGIEHLITPSYKEKIFQDSGGHPYVIKILLGEVERSRSARSLERIMATQEDILVALFQRTYAALSRPAQRLFLTVCNWNSTIPQAALEAVLLRPGSEKLDVASALLELERSSLIEIHISDSDRQEFISVPVAAQLFGRGVLQVDALRSAVQADTEFLHKFGAGRVTDVRYGLEVRIKRFIGSIKKELDADKREIEKYIPTLEFLARREPRTWLQLAALYEEYQPQNFVSRAKAAIRQFLQDVQKPAFAYLRKEWEPKGWDELIRLCAQSGDVIGELNALTSMSNMADVDFSRISGAAFRFSQLLASQQGDIDSAEKRVLAKELRTIMAKREDEASADDLSRLAWLCLHLHDSRAARRYTEKGLKLDPRNVHCQKLAERLARDAEN